MAVSGDDVISASNLASAVGLAASGDTGDKPISADNLLSIIEGGGLVGLKTLWEGSATSVTVPVDDDTQLLLVDVIYSTAGYDGRSYPLTVAVSRCYRKYFPNAEFADYTPNNPTMVPTTFGVLSFGDILNGKVKMDTYADSYSPKISTKITRVRGGVSLAEAIEGVAA